jgi:hypothetical protein
MTFLQLSTLNLKLRILNFGHDRVVNPTGVGHKKFYHYFKNSKLGVTFREILILISQNFKHAEDYFFHFQFSNLKFGNGHGAGKLQITG